ncbi:hypothetical protein BGZ65_000923, partial [Modicella reniformis]
MEKNLEKGIWAPQKVMRRIDKGLKGIIQLSEQEKHDLSVGLSQEPSFGVCRCRTEADVCMGHGTDSSSIAISGDSDLFVYTDIGTTIRPLPRRRRVFAIYEKIQVLQALDLPSSQHLVLFDIVNNNDYNNDAHGLGPFKNLRIVQSLQEDQSIVMLNEYIHTAASIIKSGLWMQRSIRLNF